MDFSPHSISVGPQRIQRNDADGFTTPVVPKETSAEANLPDAERLDAFPSLISKGIERIFSQRASHYDHAVDLKVTTKLIVKFRTARACFVDHPLRSLFRKRKY